MQIIKSSFGQFEEYILKNPESGETAHIIPQVGGIVRKLILGKGSLQTSVINIESEASTLVGDRSYPSRHMCPFAGRIEDGLYQFEGELYELDINEKDRNMALHGFVEDAAFEVVQSLAMPATSTTEGSAFLTLSYRYNGNRKGFPFQFLLTVTYSLKEKTGFSLQYKIMNVGKIRMPIGIGWHPYFSLGTGLVDDWEIQVAATHQFLVNDRLITKAKVEFDERGYFSLKDRNFDSCFLLPLNTTNETKLRSLSLNKCLTVWQDANLPYLMLYIPPNRKSIAIESQTSGINAFNTHEGMKMLLPAKSLVASCGLRIEAAL